MLNMTIVSVILILLYLALLVLLLFRHVFRKLPKIELTLIKIVFSKVDYQGGINEVCTLVFKGKAIACHEVNLGSYLTKRLKRNMNGSEKILPKIINYYYFPGLKKSIGYYDWELLLFPKYFYYLCLLFFTVILVLVFSSP